MNKLKLLITTLVLIPTQLLLGDLNLNTSQSSINGNSITAFENYAALGPNIFVAQQIAGAWVAAVAIANPLTYPTLPRTALNSLGQAVVVWMGNDIVTFTPTLYASTYNLGIWTTVILSVPALEHVIGEHQVKISETSEIIVTWASYMFLTGTNEARAVYAPIYGVWPLAINIP